MMILKEFSRIVCVSLFSYQGSLLVCLSDSLFTLPHLIDCVKYFFEVFYFSKFKTSNGEGGIWTLAPLLTTYSLSRGAPSASLGTSPNCPTQSLLIFFRSVLYYIALFFVCQELFFIYFHSQQRREWDSNPRALADKRFSRPPRYDHFDISPYALFSVRRLIARRKMYSIIKSFYCQYKFLHFLIFFKNTSATSRSSGVVIFILW